MENILSMLFVLFIAIGGVCLIGNQIIQERAEKNIKKFMGTYIAATTKLNITFEMFSYSGDPTPGSDTTIRFVGPTVQAEVTPVQALYFLETVRKDDPDIGYLEKKSEWKYSPLPK